MALINYSYFEFPIHLNTSETTTQTFLGKIIDFVEDKYLSLITYDSESDDELNDIKEMVGYFSYAYYIDEQLRVNTQIGNMNLQNENTPKVVDTSYALERYNDAVDIFNKYVTDEEDEIEYYINSFGI